MQGQSDVFTGHLGKAVADARKTPGLWLQNGSLRNLVARLSLRVQVALLTGTLCVLLVAVVSVGAAWIGRDQAARDTGARLTQLAGELAHRLDTSMAQRYAEVGTLAQMAPLRGIWTGDPAALRGVLQQMQASYPVYAWIGFATPDSTVRAATGGLLEGQSVAQRPWFLHGLNGPTVSDLHEALLLSRLLSSAKGGEPGRFVDIAFPVKDADGTVLGVLGAHLYSRWADTVLDSFSSLVAASQTQRNAQVEFQVLSADGHVIVGDQPGSAALDPAALEQVRADGMALRTGESKDGRFLEGLAVTRGERDFPGFGWIVSAWQPASEAFAAVRLMVGAILGMGAAVALLGVALFYVIAGRIAEPIRHLCQEADRIGRAPNGAKLNRVGGSKEVQLLSHALRSLVRRLGSAEQQLLDAAERANLSTARAAQQMEVLRRIADSDPMTGLLNRRGFLEAVQRSFAAPPGHGPVGTLIIDIDHFKRVNDRFGHAVGDQVIRSVATAIKETARERDLVSRFGGEEFVVFMPDATERSLMALAERIRTKVMQTRMLPGQPEMVTVSVGAAVERVNDHDVQDTIDRADVALYGAKQAGRNCTRLDDTTVALSIAA